MERPDIRALAGSLLFASVALGAGVIDRTVEEGSRPPPTGSIAGVVSGASRYRVILTPARSSGAPAADELIEGWGRGFRGDGVAPGRYRLSVVVNPDGDEPWIVVPLPLPTDAIEIPRHSSDYQRLARFTADYAHASSSGRADDVAPFFDPDFKGPSGQSRAEHLERARASEEAAETLRFSVHLKRAYRAGDRWFAELAYQGTYRVNRNGDIRTPSGLFLSELREDGPWFRFLTTESVQLPSLSGIDALPKRLLAAPDLSTIVVRAGATTVLPRPIDASVADRADLEPPH